MKIVYLNSNFLKCLSKIYKNARVKLDWICVKGHQFSATANSVNSGHWCPDCAAVDRKNNQRFTIEIMRELAKEKQGECLDNIYKNAQTKLKWQCKEGHVWKANYNSIKNGTWCPYCSGRVGITIEDMKDIAKSRGGKCLSSNYINAHTKLLWKCKNGHEWEATPNNIKRGKWCPKCSRKRLM